MTLLPDASFPSLLDAILHFHPVSAPTSPASPNSPAPSPAQPPTTPSPSSPPHSTTHGAKPTSPPFYPRLPRPSRFLNQHHYQPIQPVSRQPTALPRTSSSGAQRIAQSPRRRDSMERPQSRGHNRENIHDEPGSSAAKGTRGSPSPSRPHHLNALSPLQALSPMRSNKSKDMLPAVPLPGTDTPGAGGRSRASSITKSLSRRQSLYAHAARWAAGDEYEDEQMTNPGGLFSRLTLVKAPSESSGLKR